MNRILETLLLALLCAGTLTGCPHHRGGASAPSCPKT